MSLLFNVFQKQNEFLESAKLKTEKQAWQPINFENLFPAIAEIFLLKFIV